MAEANIFHYHAFLSYSHDDGRWGDWLHGKLEEFELDEAPLGRPTLHGRVLKPIFQDRKGFRADPSLGKQTREVLEKSAAMVVICSPSAAKSLHVAREICEFRRLPQGKRVFAFIVGGEPHDAQNECFPRPLIWTKDSDGELSVKEEPTSRWRN